MKMTKGGIMRKIMIAFAFLVITVFPVYALDYSGTTQYTHDTNENLWAASYIETGANWSSAYGGFTNSVDVVIDFQWRAYTMFQEPVFLTKAKWNFMKGGSVTLGKYDVKIPIAKIPQLVLDKISVTRIIPVYKVCEIGENCAHSSVGPYLIRDPGSLGTRGNWSYNTQGAPTWDKTFIYSLPDYFHTKEMSKEIFKKGFHLVCNRIDDIRFDASSVVRWYEAKLKKEERERQIAYAAESEDDFFEEKPEEKSDDDFFENESQLESIAQREKRITKEKEHEQTVARIDSTNKEFDKKAENLSKQAKEDQERFELINSPSEIYNDGKTVYCVFQNWQFEGKINLFLLREKGKYKLNDTDVIPNEDGTFSVPLGLVQGENSLVLYRNNEVIATATVYYTKLFQSLEEEYVFSDGPGGIIVCPKYKYTCNYCNRSTILDCLHEGVRHYSSCQSYCRIE